MLCLVLILAATDASFAASGLFSSPETLVRPSLGPAPGSTGALDTPTARVLPDWRMRASFAHAPPYRVYSLGLGLFDRLELSGQLVEVTTREGFPGEDYGSYKDRGLAARLVLLREDGLLPQVALGATDPYGTGLFASRYLVASTSLMGTDFSIGLGQGVLGGESLFNDPEEGDGSEGIGADFLLSSPWRRTRPFASISLPLADGLLFTAEYTPLAYADLFGHDDGSFAPVNLGLSYRLGDFCTVQAALLRGRDLGASVSADFGLSAQGFSPWKREPEHVREERVRHLGHLADADTLAELVCDEMRRDGFEHAVCQATDTALWLEAENPRYLSDARALSRMGRVVLHAAPPRIRELYLTLTRDGVPASSLRTGRAHLENYMASRLDREGFLAFASLHGDVREHRRSFLASGNPGGEARRRGRPWRVSLGPKVRTFLNNREGFLRHKVVLEAAAGLDVWDGGTILARTETVLYNDYDDVRFEALEEEPTRTDLVDYERRWGTHLAQLAFDQIVVLPDGTAARLALGHFEPAFGGVGAEVFRFFHDGLWGLGAESQVVRKRSLDDPLTFRDDRRRPNWTLLTNLYAQIWPEEGVDAGLSAGRFLAGDPGARLTLRRTRESFTIGGWVTVTDTGGFTSPKNRGHHDAGVFVRVPVSIFRDREVSGHLDYYLSGFTRDQGQTVAQPRRLFPVSPEGTAIRTRATLEELRR